MYRIIVTFSCCLGPLACGFALAYIFAIHPGIILGVDIGVWETYVFLMGCIGGGFFSGLLVNLGRKMTLLLTMTPFALSWLMVIFATDVWMLMAFHATAGACTGLTLVLAQVYVAEVATPGVRGAISCAPLLALQIGSLLCYSLGNVLAWRHLAAVGMGVTLPFFFAVVLCMPESPRFLVHVRPNDALATLQWLRGFEGDVMDEYRDIADSSETDRWSIDLDDLSRPTFWRPLIVSCGLMFFYSMTGLASFGLYGMELFADVSYHPVNVACYINTTIVVVGIVIASILVDQIGRKLVLLLSITIMAASAFTIGLFMFLKDYNKVESYFEYQWAAEVFCVVLFTFAHGVGMSPIAWITMGEVFGPRHKWIGVTFSSMVFWSSMIAVDLVFQYLRYTVLTGGIFWFHCVMCVAGYIFVLLCFRELKEQRIDDITKSFTKKHDSLMDTFIARV
ncbi:Major facilitator sugar transporter-like [Trinorchestia longiramus]|nr:Major facilitator sugar transporter-like [Trinorchestia longiramus]